MSESENARPVEEKTFRSHDGQELFYRYWPPAGAVQGAVVLMHRGHEHSGRMAHLADELDLPGFACFAWDARGYGRSPGVRGYSPSFGTSVRDVQSFIDHIGEQYGIAPENIALLAQSVGAVVAATWAHDYAPAIRCMVLASPAFDVKLYVPLARPGLKLLQRLRGNFFVNSYVKAKFLSHDSERIAGYDSDPLITRPISVNILLALYDNAERIVADAEAIQVPTQLLISGDDWVVRPLPQYEFFARLGCECKDIHLLPGFYHDTFGELERHLPIAKARAFILRAFAEPLQRADLLDAHRAGFTQREAAALAAPLAPGSLRDLYWRAMRGALRLCSHLSDGIRLGQRTGFDSGSTLDYVYRNQASGCTPLGRWIDRKYLDSPGWRNIRQRKLHLEELLRRAMALLAAAETEIRIVDIAAGHGRYVLEALAASAVRPQFIVLRDYSELNVNAGTALIREKGFADIARFEQGDAFDRAGLAALDPQPSIAIVSGLYELFADNDLVRGSLAGLAAAMPPGAYLLYTCQPWHPQLEFIARALT
ncbi:MAG: bifunctional alpha/beta hydrolase/class I SAM-dependent methyltransferase, partial [Gammaproteobacteria bacterium]